MIFGFTIMRPVANPLLMMIGILLCLVGTNAHAHNTSPAATSPRTAFTEQTSSIRNIDFRRKKSGAGVLEISFDRHYKGCKISHSNNHRIVIQCPATRLPARLVRTMDVTDFATPVKKVSATHDNSGTRIVMMPKPGTSYRSLNYQAGNRLTLEIRPRTASTGHKFKKTGKSSASDKISLSFQNIDVRSALQIIARAAGVNMVISDAVSGTLALKLDHVPWKQALSIILDAKSLGMTRQGNVITVAPLRDIAKLKQAKSRARQASRASTPLQSRIIQVNYARAADIAQVIRSERTRTNSKPQQGERDNRGSALLPTYATTPALLSPRGHVTVDDRTNTLLITDTPAKINKIRDLVARLDVPVRQVLIQSRIVTANRDFKRSLGVSQTGVGSASRLNDGLTDKTRGGYTVRLPAVDPTSMLSTSIISDSFALNLELSAMESENKGEIISAPRLITTDGHEANIEQGREIPYQEGGKTSLQGTSVQFKKAVLSLDVTPHITPDRKVILDLRLTQDTIGDNIPTSEGGLVPSIDTRSLDTRVLVSNGSTVVLGGIYEQTNRNATSGVPYLRKIPLLGALFRGTSREHKKQELLIFVTPRILDKDMNLLGQNNP